MVGQLTMYKKTFAFISKPFPTLKVCWNRINSTSVRFYNVFLIYIMSIPTNVYQLNYSTYLFTFLKIQIHGLVYFKTLRKLNAVNIFN